MTNNSLKNDQQLIKEAKGYFDFSILFPNSKIDARRPLTKYQKTKIRASLNELKKIAGGEAHLKRDFIPVKKSPSRTNVNATSGLNKALRGVMLPGGGKVNKNVRLKNNEIIFDRADALAVRFKPLPAKTARQLKTSIKKLWGSVSKTSTFIALGTYSGQIKYITDNGTSAPARVGVMAKEGDALDNLIKATMVLYEKYASLAGSPRTDTYGKNRGLYAHPSKWGLGLWLHK